MLRYLLKTTCNNRMGIINLPLKYLKHKKEALADDSTEVSFFYFYSTKSTFLSQKSIKLERHCIFIKKFTYI